MRKLLIYILIALPLLATRAEEAVDSTTYIDFTVDTCVAAISDSILAAVDSIPETEIFGSAEMTVDRMYKFVKAHNANFSIEVADAFFTIGERYGIRGDIALCQAILETGWFKFMDGTEVTPDQYNYGGLGVKTLGEKGNSFATMEEGVTALFQHLYAYACTHPLPDGEQLLDMRFKYVARGCAPTWEKLSGRWAMNDHYGSDILSIYSRMTKFTE